MKELSVCLISLFLASLAPAQSFVPAPESIISFENAASRSINWIDYDGDNDPDLFISTGLSSGDDNMLYRNDNGRFIRVYGQPVVEDSLPSDGSSWGDFDNNGFPDLCVVNWYNKPALLYRNSGNGNFTFESGSPVTTRNGYSETCTWGDYDNDGWLDLFITNSAGTGHRNYLYRNNGAGEFIRIDTGIVVNELARARGANWIDVDGDMDLDLFVCRELGQNEFLYKNEGNGYFVKITDSPLVNAGGETWSASWGDYDNDGDADVFLANHSAQANRLFRNDGGFVFTPVSESFFSGETGYHASSGWGDYDNDGDLDLYVTQSYVPPDFTQKLVNKLYRNMLMETGSANFEKITAGAQVSDSGYSFGFAWGDADNDGDLDLAVANTYNESQKSSLYVNVSNNPNNWLKVQCKGTSSNRSGIGAKVRVKSTIGGQSVWQLRHVEGQSGYCGQNLVLHFGLGNAAMIDSMIVQWPSGVTQVFTSIQPNRNLTVTENGSVVSINENSFSATVSGYRLSQNYPNPFNPSTLIGFEIPETGLVRLTVYDMLGKEISVLVDSHRPAGRHEVQFYGENLPSGIYFYRLSVTGASEQLLFSETGKMILAK